MAESNVSFVRQNETRFVVDLNNFGFYANGTLNVDLSSLRMNEGIVNYTKYPVRILFITIPKRC